VKLFIVGKGNNSGLHSSRLLPVVQEELAAQVPPIGNHVDARNSRVLLADAEDVAAWLTARQVC
jgi:hypothetical protein